MTKGGGSRDFDLLDENDWYGVTIDGKYSPDMYFGKFATLLMAKKKGIKTWVSFEPVIDAWNVLDCIELFHKDFDKAKIGKLNYYPSDIDWKSFGEQAETLCKKLGIDYYIKNSLRAEMEKK